MEKHDGAGCYLTGILLGLIATGIVIGWLLF